MKNHQGMSTNVFLVLCVRHNYQSALKCILVTLIVALSREKSPLIASALQTNRYNAVSGFADYSISPGSFIAGCLLVVIRRAAFHISGGPECKAGVLVERAFAGSGT
ncbi:hypothetical protein ANCDUO_15029 [Ancylostoma duodenale]|uniref:Uncharacterized protein n=1 Tax=Ancylostoma duodenale TaxID=51022 RepID=A0A0C2CEQ6_9BILA|nr:hypothetical protein ANCDUO_15029 [Ancylostoma duodenale]